MCFCFLAEALAAGAASATCKSGASEPVPELLKVTSRPTSKMLCDATAKVWPGQSPLEQKTFNNHVSEVVKVLFGKARSMTTGQRLPDSVSSMRKVIRATILDQSASGHHG